MILHLIDFESLLALLVGIFFMSPRVSVYTPIPQSVFFTPRQ